MWAQKAKCNWDINGDRNTKYFQAVVKNRRRRNRIIQIKNDSDQWFTDAGEIEQCFHHYFHSLYAQPQNEAEDLLDQLTSLPLPTLSAFQVAQLEIPISDEEIIHEVNKLGPLRQFYYGYILDFGWYYDGYVLDFRWFYYGYILVFKWYYYGYVLDFG